MRPIAIGTQPIYLFGNEETESRGLPKLCSGKALGPFGRTEPEAGFGRRGQRPRPGRCGRRGRGDRPVQAVHHQRRNRDLRDRRSRAHRPGEVSNMIVPTTHAGLRAGRALPQDGLEKRVGHQAAELRRRRGPAANLLGPTRDGLSSSCRCSTSRRIGRRAMGVGLHRGRWTKRSLRQGAPGLRASRISKFQATRPGSRHGDRDRRTPAARLQGGTLLKDRRAKISPDTAAQAEAVRRGTACACAREGGRAIHGGYGYIEEDTRSSAASTDDAKDPHSARDDEVSRW